MATRRLSELEAAARRFQDELLRVERADAGEVMSEFQRAAGRMRRALAAARAALAGGVPEGVDPAAWIREERRIRSLIALAESEMNDFAAYAAKVIRARQLQLVQQAQTHAAELAELQLPVQANTGALQRLGEPSVLPAFKTIPVEAVSHLVGSLGDGSPLRTWAEQFGSESARRIGEVLIDGLARGQGAERIASRLVDSLGGDAARALTVARTETLRAYRGAKTEWMTANKVITGWQWYARLDRTTCAACFAMHGTKHKPDETMGTHPNCRCLQIPTTMSVDEILGRRTGITEPELLPQGADVFARQPADFQREVLGSQRAFEAFQAGRVELGDFVRRRESDAWGVTRTAGSVRHAERRAAARRAGT
jgi:SPP1 gp7 family putative phage head morphogenesis protein